jgi:carbamoyltransferase
MKLLGISAFYHDSAAALIEGDRILAAAQEERFTRIKHDASFPSNAVEWMLKDHGLALDDLDGVVFYEKPFVKFERLLETYMAFAPRGFGSFHKALPLWVKEKLFQKRELLEHLAGLGMGNLAREKLYFSEHHLSHAASAFYPSPFEDAIILTMDGVGEWCTTSVAIGRGNRIEIKKEIHFPHSLGLLYSAFTYLTGFRVNSGEYKVMGLAPYGEARFAEVIERELLDIKADGSFRLNLKYFDYCTGLRMTNRHLEKLLGVKVRHPEDRVEQVHMDLAASIQVVLEKIVLRLCQSLHDAFRIPNLCLAGGVALNCVANGKILANTPFQAVWVQPASGDAGGALGSALAGYYTLTGSKRQASPTDAMAGSYLGPCFSDKEISSQLDQCGAKYTLLSESDMLDATVEALKSEQVIGWFQGRMEFGPRALGARSIIADARSPEMQKKINLSIKFRESFRPFAPSVLAECVSEWFDYQGSSPYMLMVAPVREEKLIPMTAEQEKLFGIDKLNVPRSQIPAVTHVDYSARIQTVHRDTHPRYHELISRFSEKTGCPVIVNTSFNVRGEPIVNTPQDAFRCFMGTEMDVLVVGNCILRKADQDPNKRLDYRNQFQLD